MPAPLIVWGLIALGGGSLVVAQTRNVVRSREIGVAQSAIDAGLVDEPSDFERLIDFSSGSNNISDNLLGGGTVGNGFDDIATISNGVKTFLFAGAAYMAYNTFVKK